MLIFKSSTELYERKGQRVPRSCGSSCLGNALAVPRRYQPLGWNITLLRHLLDCVALVGCLDGAEPYRLGDSATRLPGTACRRAIGGPSFVVFVAQLEPTAVAKFPEAAVAKFTSEPEAAVAEFPEAAVAKSAAVEPEDTGSGSEANAVTAKVSSAEATSAKVRPAKAAPAEAASAVTEATSTAKGRRT
jgi:hypothetical protein